MAGIFEYQIAYVEDLAAFRRLEDAAAAAGVYGLAIRVWNVYGGSSLPADNVARLLAGDRDRLGARFKVGLWSTPGPEPELGARETSRLYGELRAAFCIFETENEYKSDGGGIDPGRLWREWRKTRPRAYTGAAVQGNMPSTYDYAVGLPLGVHYFPENYWLYDGNFDLSVALANAVRLGVPYERVHPTLTGVEGHTMHEAIIRCYGASLAGQTLDTQGFALWRGDMLSAEDYRLVGLARGLARRPGL